MLSFFALDVLDEIWDIIESVSEGFLAYSSTADSYLKGSVDISKISTMSSLISRKPLTEYIMQSYWLPFGSAISCKSYLHNRTPLWVQVMSTCMKARANEADNSGR